MKTAFTLVMAFFVTTVSVRATTPTLSILEKSLNAFQTVQAAFEQVNPDETTQSGTFYLDRPNKRLRFAYDDPKGYYILAADGWLLFYDPDLQEPSYLEIEQTPAQVLLQQKVRLSTPSKTAHIISTQKAVELHLQHLDQPGHITLLFEKAPPHQLKGWIVEDATGHATKVSLKNISLDPKFAKGLFTYRKRYKR